MIMLQMVVFTFLVALGSSYGNGDCVSNARVIANLQSQLKLVSDSLGMLTNKREEVIAFHATLSNVIKDLPENSPLVFNAVKVNIGGGFNSTNGKFTAPVGGVYVCDWTILTKKNDYFYSELVVNGEQKSVSNLYSSFNILRQASTMTIVILNKGDKVWIKPLRGYKGSYAVGGEWCKFSCFKL